MCIAIIGASYSISHTLEFSDMSIYLVPVYETTGRCGKAPQIR